MTTTNLTNVASIKVAPGIGLGRVGNSDEFFIGPETPGVVPDPGNKQYKDAQGRIKRQAQRFRVYAYNASGDLLGEITEGTTVNGESVTIDWQVHVTNMKSANYAFQGKYAFDPKYLRNSTVQADLPPAQRDKLIIDPGVKSVSGANHCPVELLDPEGSKIFDIDTTSKISGILNFTNPSNPELDENGMVDVTYAPAIVSLGNISTDDNGRLIFVGGKGESKSCTTPSVVIAKTSLPSGVQALENSTPAEKEIQENPEYNLNSYFNNPGWYDDTCGGSVNVTITGNTVNFATNDQADRRGWVAVAPPHYAPACNNVVSLLDLQMDIFPEADPYSGHGPFYVAQASANKGLQLSASTTAPVITSEPVSIDFTDLTLPSGVETEITPAMINYQGKNHIALVSTDGDIYIGIEDEQGGYSFNKSVGAVNATSSPALAVLNNVLYLCYNQQGVIMLGQNTAPVFGQSENMQAGINFTFTNPNIGSSTIDSTQAPALIAFNGAVFLSVIDSTQQLLVGDSASNPTGVILNLTPATFQNDSGAVTELALLPSTALGMTFYVGAIRIGFIATDLQLYIASSTDGKTFTYEKIDESTELSAARNTSSDELLTGYYYGISLTSFNNKLYFVLAESFRNITSKKFAISNDGENFHFQALTDAALATPTVSANIPVNFYRDIYPILKTVTDYAWTNERAFHGHRPGTFGDFLHPNYLPTLASPSAVPQTPKATPDSPNMPSPNITRLFVFNFIRPPSQQVYLNTAGALAKYDVPPPPVAAVPSDKPHSFITANTGVEQRADLMPRLFGNGGSPLENGINGSTFPNQWLPLTNHQLEKFQQWVNGNFVTGTVGEAAYQDIPEPEQLSFAALQPTVGGGFHPGIELTYLMHEEHFFDSPFRFTQATVPGAIAAYMSVPWQGDFWSCNVSWWPALRPDIVVERSADTPPVLTHQQWFRGNSIPPDSNNIADYEGGYEVMVEHWHDLGFVTPVEGLIDRGQQVYEETERNASLDTPSLLSSISVTGQEITGLSLAYNSSNNFVAAATSATATDQQWQLVRSSADAGYVFIQKAGTNDVLTVDFSTGDISLQTLSPYNEDSQLWQYQSTETQQETENALTKITTATASTLQNSVGYPGHFNLVSKLNLKLLTVNNDNSVSTVSSTTTLSQLWKLESQQEENII